MATLAQDPSYLAWMRALGFDDQAAQADAAQKEAAVKSTLDLQRPEIEYQGGLTRRDISQGMEDRGLFRSGQHEQALAEQMHGQQAQLAALELGSANDIAGIQSDLATQLAAARRQAIEQQFGLAQSLETAQQAAPYRTSLAAPVDPNIYNLDPTYLDPTQQAQP